MSPLATVVCIALAGSLARTAVPYAQMLFNDPETKFDRKFLVPPLMALLITLLTFPFTFAALPKEILESAMSSPQMLAMLFIAAWGLTDVARATQKATGG